MHAGPWLSRLRGHAFSFPRAPKVLLLFPGIFVSLPSFSFSQILALSFQLLFVFTLSIFPYPQEISIDFLLFIRNVIS